MPICTICPLRKSSILLGNDTVAYWSAISVDGYSNYFVIIGDPVVYLENFANNNFNTNNSYIQFQWNALSKNTTFPSLAYDIGRDLVAISQTNPKTINIDQLSLALSGIGYYKYIINNLPLSNSVSLFAIVCLFFNKNFEFDACQIPGLAFATNFNLLYWVDSMFQYIGVVELSNYQWTKIVDKNLEMPHSIAVHEAKGYVHSKIEVNYRLNSDSRIWIFDWPYLVTLQWAHSVWFC